LLLITAGVITSVPLVCFTSAARRLRYSTIGIIQYLAPTLQFVLAVFFYRETFDFLHLLSFILIWIGLAVFAIDSVATQSRAQPDRL
jgi:chloramphenicol-sensitive protein RarD